MSVGECVCFASKEEEEKVKHRWKPLEIELFCLLLLKRSSVAQNNRHRKGRKNRGELQCCRLLRCAVLEELEVSHYCFCDSAGAVSELSRCTVGEGC